jgi:nucleotide-binding universal stress UspA family protein
MGPIRTIVCGFGTPLMQSRSLHGAVWLARHTGADLHAVFVPTPGMDGCGYGRRYCDLWEEFERTIPRLHERSRMACRFRGDTLEGRVLELAGQVKADLVVMEAPRPEPGHRALAAPGLQALLAHTSIPVLIVHVLPVTGLRTLIAGGPAAGEHSFLDLTREVLEPLFGSASAEWRLLDVIGPREDVHLRGAWLRAVVASCGRGDRYVTPVVRQGEPAAEITAECLRWFADLLVLGGHSQRGFGLDPITTDLVSQVRANVLVIPFHEHQVPVEIQTPGWTAESDVA